MPGGTRSGAGAEVGDGGLDLTTAPTKLEGNRPILPFSEPRIQPSNTHSCEQKLVVQLFGVITRKWEEIKRARLSVVAHMVCWGNLDKASAEVMY